MKFEVNTSNYDILDSGSIIVPEGDFVEFKIDTLCFRFNFVQNDELQGEEKSKITGEIRDNVFNMTVYNYKGLFATPNQMMNVAQIQGKQLSVRFSIVELSSKDSEPTRIFHYTWYKSK